MSTPDDDRVPEPQGKFGRVPYDWRRRNPDDPRLLTPKSFGWGFDLNLYRLIHWRRRP